MMSKLRSLCENVENKIKVYAEQQEGVFYKELDSSVKSIFSRSMAESMQLGRSTNESQALNRKPKIHFGYEPSKNLPFSNSNKEKQSMKESRTSTSEANILRETQLNLSSGTRLSKHLANPGKLTYEDIMQIGKGSPVRDSSLRFPSGLVSKSIARPPSRGGFPGTPRRNRETRGSTSRRSWRPSTSS
jgi:hypothetical protein